MQRLQELWIDLIYQLDVVWSCIHLKAFLLSLPVVYTSYFFADWHLIEIWMCALFADLITGALRARKENRFSWVRVRDWAFKVFVHCMCALAAGAVSHMASVLAGRDIPFLDAFVTVMATWEIGSALDHAKAMGWPVPEPLYMFVHWVHERAFSRIRKSLRIDRNKEDE